MSSSTLKLRCPNHYCVGGWVPWDPNESRAAPPIPCRHEACPHRLTVSKEDS